MDSDLRQRARSTLDQLRHELLAERVPRGHWTGQLSGSALSTATAVSAMATAILSVDGEQPNDPWLPLIERGMGFLCRSQNADGGFGDTDRSHSNIATSYLVLAASALASQAVGAECVLTADRRDQLQQYIDRAGGLDGLRRRYGKDKTFVVPIMTNMAIAGLVDWSQVAALPFEAAVFPQSMYRILRMPVVSYAIPALVAIGQARHFLGPRAWFPIRWIRGASVDRTMSVLRRMQPESGGYLEATPLTSFVVMSLAATRRADCEVAQKGLQFLSDSVLDDGSWPIDTNLATWVTSLAIHALVSDPEDDGSWCSEGLVSWHLGCQHRTRHPFTGAEPGGWGWTDLSGAVPDGDDTPAAIIAIGHCRDHVSDEIGRQIDDAVRQGIRWIANLQNRDGGWPTFCRGWGKLPFDRSSTDLTAHAMRALRSFDGIPPAGNGSDASTSVTDREIDELVRRGGNFLQRTQRDDGSWLPLWFGNQDLADETNPVYGTARVLVAGPSGAINSDAIERGAGFLISNQNRDGGWGGGPSLSDWVRAGGIRCPPDLSSSVEETALAVEALVAAGMKTRKLSTPTGVATNPGEDGRKETRFQSAGMSNLMEVPKSPPDSAGTQPCSARILGGGNPDCRSAIIRGIEFLVRSVEDGRHRTAWPIGFYFAKLWYHERLYPLIFTVTALGAYLRATAEDWQGD